ncbi:MAG: alpha/beta hydrolase [Telmatospirillum sp.]|nr:alpha/beta hydrolase [Telmatospirillum sp.]
MDRAALDRAYQNGAAVPDTAAILESWRVRSGAYRRLHPALLDQAWGSHARQATDFFDCGVAGAPTLLFVHGGYWHYPQHSREAFSALATGLVEHGVHVALAGYRLAPEATLAEIVGDVATATAHLAGLRRAVGADPARLCVAGWSAGGHLAALAQYLPGVSACLAISGIFDLEPMRLCFVKDKLALSQSDVADFSPIHRPPPPQTRLAVSVGGEELPELRRQSADYAAVCRAAGADCRHMELAGHNHFTILDELAESDGALAVEALRLLECAI